MEMFGSKLFRSWRRCNFLCPRVYDRVLRHNSTCSNVFSSSSASSSSSVNDKYSSFPLYKRISLAGDPKISMASILDQWVSEGYQICPADLHTIITRLRNFKRFSHALQVCAWMGEKISPNLSLKDVATQLQLISKVHGLEQAEKYFVNLPETLRSPLVYNALLNCYADARSLKKAEDLMLKMKRMGFAKVTVPYNVMLKMYFQMEMYDKAEQILQEMEQLCFSGDTFTHRIQLTAYSNTGKVKEMELVLRKMEADPQNTRTPSDYITTANGYLRAGVVDKSVVMLRRAEHLARGKSKKHVYHCLLTLYAQAKAKEEVFRIWNLYKRSWNVHNKGHLCMVSALVILDDLEGANKIIDEWAEGLSADQKVDFRVINPLIRAYCKKGDMESALSAVDKVRERSCQEPQRGTWEILATGYHVHDQMEDAVKTMKKALLADDCAWKINKASLIRCLDYLNTKGNLEELQEFTSLVEEHGYTAEDLLHDHPEDAGVKSGFRDQVEEDGMDSLGIIISKRD